MASPDKALLQMEGGVTAKALAALATSDNQVFTYAGTKVWSMDADYEPLIMPNGIVTGRKLLSAGGAADEVDVAGCTVNVNGVEVSVTAGTVSISRPATDVAIVNAVCVDASGTLSVEAGTDGSGGTYSETYGAAGGPPLIPDTKVMLGQVRVNAAASVVVADSEIFQADGVHNERFDMPMWRVPNATGVGLDASSSDRMYAHVEFESALPEIHASGAKAVYGQLNEPIMSDISRSVSVVTPQKTYSSNEEEYYGGSVSSVAQSLGQGSFEVLMNDGVTDGIKRAKGKIKTFKWYPDRNKSPFALFQGTVGVSVSNPVGKQIRGALTVTPLGEAADFAA